MLTPSLNTVMTRLLIVAAVLGTIVLFAPAIFAQDAGDVIMYAENGTDPVRTFTSTDPEGAGIDWDVTGLDADDFQIDARGMLMFNRPPNYEKPTDRGDAPDAADTALADRVPTSSNNNLYVITVRATEQVTGGADVRALSTETHVIVEVTNVNEDGSASMNVLQPEVAWPVKARLSDADTTDGDIDYDGSVGTGANQKTLGWRWYVSKVSNPVADVDDHWTPIDMVADNPENIDTVESTYIPRGKRVAGADDFPADADANVAVDEEKYLRAVVTYLDMGNDDTDDTDDAPVVADVRTAIVVSENPVRAEVSSENDDTDGTDPIANPENGSPGFSSVGTYTRTIAENSASGTPLGDPVVATEPNAADTLTYELDNDKNPDSAIDAEPETLVEADAPIAAPNTNDVTLFKVGMSDGQITVNGTLNHEGGQDGVYKFYIRATDPSGERDEQLITVNVTDQNDAPRIMASLTDDERKQNADNVSTAAASELRVMEQDSDRDGNGSPDDPYTGLPDMPLPGVEEMVDGENVVVAGLGAPNVFTATDQDARGQIFWALEGEDADDFVLTSTGLPVSTGLGGPDEPIAIRFASPPDYENPTDANLDGVYKVTMVATDSPGARATRDLTIFVDNEYEQGAVVLSDEQPLIDQAISATIEDPDNNLAVVTWQWRRATSAAATTWEVIEGATAGTYVPRKDDKTTQAMEQDDNGYYLRVVATYTDVTSDPDNMAATSVYIDERTAKPFETDDQVPVAKVAVMGDGSDVDGNATDKLYRVMTTSKNAVRVAPTDPTQVAAPEFASTSFDRTVAENAEVRTIVGDPIQVVPELDDKGKPKTAFTYDIRASITGDEDFFTIDLGSGQIRVGEVPFPDPIPAEVSPTTATEPGMVDPTLDYEGDNTFSLIVTATDKAASSRKVTAEVSITLANLNEAPYFDKESRDKAMAATDHPTLVDTDIIAIRYAESRTNPVVQLAAVEPDGTALRWELTGADASDFAIEDVEDVNDGKDRVQLVFASPPNYEGAKDGAGDANRDGIDDPGTDGENDNIYHVTVRATEMSAVGGGPNLADELDVTVQVTNSNEAGEVTFAWLQPEVGTPITASVSDPDSPDDVAGTINYTWYRSKVTNPNRNPGSTDAALAGEWEQIESEWAGLSDNLCAPDPVSTTAPSDDTYTPQGDCAETPTVDERTEGNAPLDDEIDEGDFLLVRAVYTDGTDVTATSTGITAYAVRNDVSDDANNSPDFNASSVTREIAEDASKGDPVGDPVAVMQNEDDDILTYEIVQMCRTDAAGTPCAGQSGNLLDDEDGSDLIVPGDVASFDIDPATGQIMVDGAISYEGMGEVRGPYTVVVRATDPAGEGEESRDDIVVTINVTDVNEAPKVTVGAFELAVYESNSTDKDTVFDKYVGLGYMTDDDDDPDNQLTLDPTNPNLYKRSEEDLVDRAIWPEPIAGPDGALFEYSIPADGIGRRLHFKEAPDFENPLDANRDNVYEVTITVQDSAGAMGTRNVRVTVMNVDEAGKFVLSPEQPDDGMPVVATISDPDGVVSITNWAWATATSTRVVGDISDDATGASDANGDGVDDVGAAWTVMSTATTDEYMAEAGQFVWAMVDYRDGASSVDDPVTVLDERNDDPETTDADQIEQHKYKDRNAQGETVDADTLFHNSDEMKSGVSANAVQPDPDDPDAPTGPSTGVVRIDRSVFENVPSTGYVGVPIDNLGYKTPGGAAEVRNVISGPDGSSFVFAEDYDNATNGTVANNIAGYQDDAFYVYYDAMLQGTEDGDNNRVEIPDDKIGQLALRPVTHLDAEGKDTYVIEISDPNATVAVSTYRVTITVMDVNDPPTAPSELKGTPPALNTAPEFAATSTTRMVAENTAAGTAIGDPVEAMDADRGDTLSYELGGADAASFTIDSATGQLMTSAALDYETDMEYMVTVTTADSEGETDMIYVTIMVTNVGLDNAYDGDDSGDISRDEVIMAINDYLLDGSIGRAEVIAVINLYLGIG